MIEIYCVTNTKNGKIYVGRTCRGIKVRWAAHIAKARRGSCRYFAKAIMKYGPDGFSVTVLDTTEDHFHANWLESFYIGLTRANNPTYGYNLTNGGDGKVGYKPSEETKERIRAGNVGQKRSVETIERLRVSHLGKGGETHPCWGRTLSSETKAKMGLPKKGKPWPESRRQAQNFKNDFARYFGNEFSKILKG